MDMIAMLAGLGGPVDPWSTGTAYTGTTGGGSTTDGKSTSGSGTSRGWSWGTKTSTATGNAVSTAAGYGTVEEYLQSKNLLSELPALAKPNAVTAASPYGPEKLTEQAFLASIGLPSGRIPMPREMVLAARKKATDYVAGAGQSTPEIAKRKQRLLRSLLLAFDVPGALDVWEVQMANKAIVDMAQAEPWFNDKAGEYIEEQQDRYGKPPMKHVGARAVYELVSNNPSYAPEVLRNMAAQREVFGPLSAEAYSRAMYLSIPLRSLNIKPPVGASGSSAYRGQNLFGLGAIPGGWQPLREKINQDPDRAASAIIAASILLSNQGAGINANDLWSAASADVATAIAEGVIVRLYADALVKLKEWRAARDQYVTQKRWYDAYLLDWQRREAYRSNRTKAIEEYYTAVANKLKSDAEKKEYRDRRDALRRGAEAAEAEKTAARLKKEAEDALAAKATAEQTARDLQTALDNLSNAGSTADVAALNATIEQLKQELVAAQNAAAEAARRANETTTTSGGDTTGAVADATQSATDATQIAADALNQAGEEVTFKPKEKKGGGVMLLVVGAIAVGGYMWMKRRQLRQIGP